MGLDDRGLGHNSRRVADGFGAMVPAGADDFGTSGGESRRPPSARTVRTALEPVILSASAVREIVARAEAAGFEFDD